MGGRARQSREVDGFLVPILGICVGCVSRCDERCEAGIVRGIDWGVGSAELMDRSGRCGDVREA